MGFSGFIGFFKSSEFQHFLTRNALIKEGLLQTWIDMTEQEIGNTRHFKQNFIWMWAYYFDILHNKIEYCKNQEILFYVCIFVGVSLFCIGFAVSCPSVLHVLHQSQTSTWAYIMWSEEVAGGSSVTFALETETVTIVLIRNFYTVLNRQV